MKGHTNGRGMHWALGSFPGSGRTIIGAASQQKKCGSSVDRKCFSSHCMSRDPETACVVSFMLNVRCMLFADHDALNCLGLIAHDHHIQIFQLVDALVALATDRCSVVRHKRSGAQGYA
jgi:hypothetical protein